jgi:hypothetical protein
MAIEYSFLRLGSGADIKPLNGAIELSEEVSALADDACS